MARNTASPYRFPRSETSNPILECELNMNNLWLIRVALVKFHMQEPPSVHVLSRGRMNWLLRLPLVHPPKPNIGCTLQDPRGLNWYVRRPSVFQRPGAINQTTCLALTLFLLSGRALWDYASQGPRINTLGKGGRGQEGRWDINEGHWSIQSDETRRGDKVKPAWESTALQIHKGTV
jgi:hypothetical protein